MHIGRNRYFPSLGAGFLHPAEVAPVTGLLATAIEDEEWETVVSVIEHEWGILMALDLPTLDRALRALPARMLSAHPIVFAVREIRLNIRGETDALDHSAGRVDLPTHPDDLRDRARSELARISLSAATAFMIAYRVHGRHQQALYYARITEELARRARVHQPNEFVPRVPTALLQVGITKLLVGDHHEASLVLREAYELRHESWDGRNGPDASGKLALLNAVRGEIVEAERWLDRHDEGDGAHGWMVPLVRLSGAIARALIAIARMDQPAAQAALATLELQVNRERSWAPFITYAQAQYALLWGDRRAALQIIERTRRFAGRSLRQAGAERLLDAVEASLLLALERPTEANALLDDRDRNAYTAAVASRLALLTDRKPLARELATAGLAEVNIDAGAQTDLLIASALADASDEDGRRHLTQAIATTARTGMLTPFVVAPRTPLRQLLGTMTPSETHTRIDRMLVSSPEPTPERAHLVELTATERRILLLSAEGRSRQDIALELYVSANTVKFHFRNVYRKLDVDSREDALATARRLGLLPPER